MKILIIFDKSVNMGRIGDLSIKDDDEAIIFPLTSTAGLVDGLISKIKKSGCDLRIVETAKEVNLSAESLRSKYIKFIADIPDRVHRRGLNLKEMFLVDKEASLWWFSSVSEKNTIESEAFNRLSQLDAIINVIERDGIQRIFFGCDSQKLKKALALYLCDKAINFSILPIVNKRVYVKKHFRDYHGLFRIKHLTCLVYAVLRSTVKVYAIRRICSHLKRGVKKDPALMFVTYYPYFDRTLADKGIFRNNYYMDLQDALEKDGQDIVWVAMYVKNNSMSYDESLTYFRKFVENGHKIYFLEEFTSLVMLAKALWIMLVSSIKFINTEKAISEMHTFGKYNFYPLLKDEWHASFMGDRGYCSLVQYYSFMSAINSVNTRAYVYCCEMRAWEKALILARDTVRSKAPIFCYQHAAVSNMLLNYFNDPTEVVSQSKYAIPKPDKIVCNGIQAYNYLRESGWEESRIAIAEAIRYSHIKRYMNDRSEKRKDIILLAFSTSYEESCSLLNVAYEALKDLKNAEVWIRPHPFMPFNEISKMSGISLRDMPFQVKEGPLENIVVQAKVVIAGESSVSLEALAAGCEVIIVNVPDWINMSQLKNVSSRKVRSVNSSEELRRAVSDILTENHNTEDGKQEVRRIMGDFFCLDVGSDIPRKFINLLRS